MKFSTATCLLAAASSATAVIVANDPTSPKYIQPEIVGGPGILLPERDIEERQGAIATNVQATLAVSQYPSVTTQWWEGTMAAAPYTSWYAETYTQTFASVCDQWPSAGSGAIGYGSLSKRDAMPEPTPNPGIAGRLRI